MLNLLPDAHFKGWIMSCGRARKCSVALRGSGGWMLKTEIQASLH